jgi:hypothetical protein
MVSLAFLFDIVLSGACNPVVDLACDRNVYKEYFMGVKEAGV